MKQTKVICPNCGSEFAIPQHESTVQSALVIGKDSGLGIIQLPLAASGKKRVQELQAKGVDTSQYFAIDNPKTGGKTLMHWVDGVPTPVDADDPVMQCIIQGKTVPNRNLFRRWIMSQMFHGLILRKGLEGFTEWINNHGYGYQWSMITEELRVQAKLSGQDPENFRERNLWFDGDLVRTMLLHYVEQLEKYIKTLKTHKCKGVPYVKLRGENIFVADLDKKVYKPVRQLARRVHLMTPDKLYNTVRDFCCRTMYKLPYGTNQCPDWKDAYKGMGAYATMKNMLLFHDCQFPRDNDFYNRKSEPTEMLWQAALAYRGEGWRMIGLMKQLLDENGYDEKAIRNKIKAWRTAKSRK